MFDYLKPYDTILLTGPHRAGTTIAAIMIANDLGYEYHEEEDVFYTYIAKYEWVPPGAPIDQIDLRRYFALVDAPLVLRCPAFCSQVHRYTDVPDLAVVLMRRELSEILASQQRVRWGFEGKELAAYRGHEGPIARVKYTIWDREQKAILGDRAFELDYESLSQHPLWIPKEERSDFHVRQYREDEPLGPRYQLKAHEMRRLRQYSHCG